MGDLEGLVGEQGREMREGQRAAEDAIREVREEQAQGLRKIERALAGLNVGGGGDGEAPASTSQTQWQAVTAQAGVPRAGDPGPRR